MAPAPSGSTTLFADLDVEVELDAPLARHTWYGIGGRADALVHPRSAEALATLLRRCARNDVRVRVLGEGANLLVADEGVDGVVVRLDAPAFKGLQLNAEGPVTRARAGGGRDLGKTIRETVAAGLRGLEPLIGIPASIGGAVRMNAGGKYGAIGDVVETVGVVTWDGQERVFSRDEIGFGYRRCGLPAGIVTWAVLRLEPSDPVELGRGRGTSAPTRRACSPWGRTAPGACTGIPSILPPASGSARAC